MSFPEEKIHPETLEEKTPEFIVPFYQWITYTLTTYGWHLAGVFLLGLYIWNQLQPTLNRWRAQYEECRFAAECKKNPDLIQSRQEAIEKARRRMQEEHDRQAAIHAERRKALEEKKTLERLERAVGSEGQRLGEGATSEAGTSSGAPSEASSSKKTSFKPEYNPLMGSGGSGGYRPQKKGCPGGGCGKKRGCGK